VEIRVIAASYMRAQERESFLNVNKTKEIVIDFRKRSGGHAPVYIDGDEVEMVESFTFLGVQITNNLHATLKLRQSTNASTEMPTSTFLPYFVRFL